MAKVTGGLFSLKCSGNFGKQIIFTTSRSVSIVKGFFISKDKKSTAQLTQRQLYKDGVDEWNTLPDETKDYYNVLAYDDRLTGYNYFLKLFLNGFEAIKGKGIYDIGAYDVSLYDV